MIASPNALVHAARKAVAAQVARAPAASKVKSAPAERPGGVRPATGPSKKDLELLASDVLGALISAQARDDRGLHLGHANRKPKPQPAPAPAPEPAPAPAPAAAPTPAVVVRDDPAPAMFLGRVRESLRDRPESQFSSQPFSQRDKPAAMSPETLQALGGAFYTAGGFRPVQAMAMRAAIQGQAGLVLLQAGALSVNRLI